MGSQKDAICLPGFIGFKLRLHHARSDATLCLGILVRWGQIAHFDLGKFRIVMSTGSLLMLRVPILAGHAGLQVLHNVAGSHVDALKDVHLGRDRALCRRVAHDVDEDVVVHLLRVRAENRKISMGIVLKTSALYIFEKIFSLSGNSLAFRILS